jgi:S1-C subfamily serine protease
MVERTFAELVRDLRMRRTNGERPPVLLLGAGASVDAGIGAMDELYKFFGVADFDAFSKFIAPTSPAERYRYLADFLQKREPTQMTPGYQALATLCAQNYFDLVLTTNMDPLLDDALTAARPPLWRKDFLLLVNGVIRPDRLTLLLHSGTPRVKVLKLHGEVFQPFMAWTVEEMDTFLREIAPSLKPAIASRDVLVVGHSLRDERVRDLAQTTGGDLWFTHPSKVPDYLKGNAAMRVVVAPEAAFEKFFPALAQALLLETPTVPVAPTRPAPAALPPPSMVRVAPAQAARSLDDLIASVLTIVGPGRVPSSTAFLLDEPRVIVCNAFAVRPLVKAGGELELLMSDGRRFKTHILRTNGAHAFGPTMLAVPDGLQSPGLRLDPSSLQRGDVVQVVVAAGEKTGVSTGAMTRSVMMNALIEPIGWVNDLVSIDAVTRPGSSGAPVVDNTMAVRGFIVAGSTNESNPMSLMYPSRYWVDFVTGRPAARTTGTRKTKIRTTKKAKKTGPTRQKR